ncbi:hypothetical protein BZG36_00757 [Bifiguratus adelaidae]|uniref:SH3 domain-containing protein n=1 Tax=Bifiguratus adelaidae TaxID=1938954 RepID=A0A261Y6Z5_9FUNG|nr:hypothetical protein BZG36_00757 [Bifiguratus adelaidae]
MRDKFVKAYSVYEAQREDELSLSVGDTIKVTNDSEPDWWTGEKEDGSSGWFPSNFVSPAEPSAPAEGEATAEEETNSGVLSTPVYARVEEEYVASESDELTLRLGGIVTVLEKHEGWWKGEMNGKVGMFPAEYVTEIEVPHTTGSGIAEAGAEGAEGEEAHKQQKPAFKLAAFGVKQGGLGSLFAGGGMPALRKSGRKESLEVAPQIAVKEPETKGPEPVQGETGPAPEAFPVPNEPAPAEPIAEAAPPIPASRPPAPIKRSTGTATKAIATHRYDAANDDELSLIKGEIITIVDMDADEGWWRGTNERGIQGVFPENFVKVIEEDDEDEPPPPPIRTRSPQANRQSQLSDIPPPLPGGRPSSMAGKRSSTGAEGVQIQVPPTRTSTSSSQEAERPFSSSQERPRSMGMSPEMRSNSGHPTGPPSPISTQASRMSTASIGSRASVDGVAAGLAKPPKVPNRSSTHGPPSAGSFHDAPLSPSAPKSPSAPSEQEIRPVMPPRPGSHSNLPSQEETLAPPPRVPARPGVGEEKIPPPSQIPVPPETQEHVMSEEPEEVVQEELEMPEQGTMAKNLAAADQEILAEIEKDEEGLEMPKEDIPMPTRIEKASVEYEGQEPEEEGEGEEEDRPIESVIHPDEPVEEPPKPTLPDVPAGPRLVAPARARPAKGRRGPSEEAAKPVEPGLSAQLASDVSQEPEPVKEEPTAEARTGPAPPAKPVKPIFVKYATPLAGISKDAPPPSLKPSTGRRPWERKEEDKPQKAEEPSSSPPTGGVGALRNRFAQQAATPPQDTFVPSSTRNHVKTELDKLRKEFEVLLEEERAARRALEEKLEAFMNVYEPAEDTFLFLDALEGEADAIRARHPSVCLEIGSGSGCISAFLAKLAGPALYICTDLNKKAAIATVKTSIANSVPLDVIRTSLVDGLVPRLNKRVDILTMNPPYAVTPSEEVGSQSIVASWAGGVDGRQVIDAVLPKVKHLLSPGGVFYLLVIEENKPKEIMEMMKTMGFESSVP